MRHLIVFVPLLLSACTYTVYEGPSGFNRVHVSKAEGKAPVTTRTPIRVTEEKGFPLFSSPETTLAAAPAAAAPEPILPAAVAPAPIAQSTAPIAVESFSQSSWERSHLEIESGVDQFYVLTHLKTAFRSSSSPQLDFENRVSPSGSGAHGAIYFSKGEWSESEGSIGVGGGSFHGTSRRDVSSGSLYAHETSDVHGTWVDVRFKYRPEELPFLFARLSAALFAYTVDTRVVTNAAAFEYDGLSGTRGLGAAVLGGGLITPWDFPLKASVEAAWWLTNAQDPPIETGIGQLSANLILRF